MTTLEVKTLVFKIVVIRTHREEKNEVEIVEWAEYFER